MILGRKFVSSALAFVVAMGPSSLVLAEPILVNGNFTQNASQGTASIGQIGYNTSLYGWSSPVNNAYNFLFSAPDSAPVGQYGALTLAGVASLPFSGNFIGMDGPFQTGAIQQALHLIVGDKYAISFDYAFSQQTGGYTNYTAGLDVSVGGTTEFSTSSSNIKAQTSTPWHTETFTFTATATTETLAFLATGSVGEPPFSLVGNVTAAVVPEPGSLVLAGIGALGLGVVHLVRRKKRTVTA